MPLLRTHNVPVENDLKSDRVYRSLSDANNEHFDRKFLDTLIGWYEGDLKHLESAAQESENPELRQFASQQAGPLQDELKAARELRENLSK